MYAILDAETCARRALALLTVARAWRAEGVQLIQYRDKQGSDAEVLCNAKKISEIFAASDAFLFLNDRVHLVREAGFHGAHVGQGDLAVLEARRVLGPDMLLGISTHSVEQAVAADTDEVDYLAIGPVFPTATKVNPDPVVGLAGVRSVRSQTGKPLVAIGGITSQNGAEVLASGADSVAVISGLLPKLVDPGRTAEALEQSAQDFQAHLRVQLLHPRESSAADTESTPGT